MNIVLFDPRETTRPLPLNDERARHILRVLRREVGDTFDAGLIDGPRGRATLAAIDDEALHLSFTWSPPHDPPPPTILIIGLPRPQTARDILRDATTLGATALHFVATARSDSNYAASSLWKNREWRRHAIAGAAQAFDTHLPIVSWDQTLERALDALPSATHRFALDSYGASTPLHALTLNDAPAPVALCLGPERGWDDRDRSVLRRHECEAVHLGQRVLRLETAVTASLTLLSAARARSPA